MRYFLPVLFILSAFDVYKPLRGSDLEEAQKSKDDLITALAITTGNPSEFLQDHAADFRALTQDDLKRLKETNALEGALDPTTVYGQGYEALKKERANQTWTGVTVDRGYLKLVPDLRRLSYVQCFTFSNNHGLILMPPWIGQFKHLKELSMHGNRLQFLPESLKNLRALERLDLGANCMTILPPVVGELKSLKELDISCNNFKESPVWLGTMTQLETLILTLNSFLQGLPPTFANLVNLKFLGYDQWFLNKESFNAVVRQLVENQKALKRDSVKIQELFTRAHGDVYGKEFDLSLFETSKAPDQQ